MSARRRTRGSILVTGGAGYIGSHVVRQLGERDEGGQGGVAAAGDGDSDCNCRCDCDCEGSCATAGWNTHNSTTTKARISMVGALLSGTRVYAPTCGAVTRSCRGPEARTPTDIRSQWRQNCTQGTLGSR